MISLKINPNEIKKPRVSRLTKYSVSRIIERQFAVTAFRRSLPFVSVSIMWFPNVRLHPQWKRQTVERSTNSNRPDTKHNHNATFIRFIHYHKITAANKLVNTFLKLFILKSKFYVESQNVHIENSYWNMFSSYFIQKICHNKFVLKINNQLE